MLSQATCCSFADIPFVLIADVVAVVSEFCSSFDVVIGGGDREELLTESAAVVAEGEGHVELLTFGSCFDLLLRAVEFAGFGLDVKLLRKHSILDNTSSSAPNLQIRRVLLSI